jgi:hypothetical protein
MDELGTLQVEEMEGGGGVERELGRRHKEE